MCTVSVLRLPGDVLRLACNRDEAAARPDALPPVVRRFGPRRALMPVDPVSDGTWVAANDAGLVLALLNYNPRRAGAAAAPLSRGTLIPTLLGFDCVPDAVAAVAGRIRPHQYGPFRLVAFDSLSVAEVVFDGTLTRACSLDRHDQPLLFTSSGLGDHLVERPRRELFEQMMRGPHPAAAAQDAFHRHQWPDRPHLSVRMRRPGARTVSTTTIEVRPHELRMRYEASAGPTSTQTLRLHVTTCG